MEIKITISVGELLDKISILKIKSSKFSCSKKLEYVNRELSKLIDCAETHEVFDESLLHELEDVNRRLWDIEDEIRVLEKSKDFSDNFIELARKVYITNDKRFILKCNADEKYESIIREQKDYINYDG